MNLDVVLIHGFWSSPATWDAFVSRARRDENLVNVAFHPFGYESPKVGRPFSTVRIPDYNDIAQSLPSYLAARVRADASVAFVTHSQGGLILQRFFAWMLSEGRGCELAQVKLAILLSCPNEGSEFLRSIRAVVGYGRHPQARDLITLSEDVAEARRIVMRQIVNATSTDQWQCRIPLYVYAGRSDNVVQRTSAYSAFPQAAVLPGDHFSILAMDAPDNLTYSEIKRLLLSVEDPIISSTEIAKAEASDQTGDFASTDAAVISNYGNIDSFPTPGKKPPSKENELKKCSFCGKSQKQVDKLISSSDKYFICDECIDLSIEIVDESNASSRAEAVAHICELTVKLASVVMPLEEQLKYQEELDQAALKVRSARRPRPDDELAGATLVRIVGAGNFGTVWQGSRRGEPCAVKIFDSDKVTIGMMLWRFQRGIRAMQHLTALPSPKPTSICEIWDINEDRLAFSMPYLPSGDLSALKRLGWSPSKKHSIFVGIANAVDFAHRNGVVHRDIKPANIVLDSQYEPVLTDFDIADLTFAVTQSITAASLGTPSFAAPEQLEGQLQAAPTADIYSLGKLLNFLITEAPPPLGSTYNGRHDDNSYLLSSLPGPHLRELVGRCIQINPEERFQSVGELLEKLPASFDS